MARLQTDLPAKLTSTEWRLVTREIGAGRLTNCVTLLTSILAKDDAHRREALYYLGELGPAANMAVPALISLLQRSDVGLHFEVIHTLGKVGPAAAPAIPLLMDELRNPNGTRNAAASALGGIGKTARESVPLLKECIAGKDTRLGFYCLNALVRISDTPEPYLRALLREADQPHRKGVVHVVTIEALETCAALGGEAKLALPFILKQLSHPDEWPRGHALKAVTAIGPGAESAITRVQWILNDTTEAEEVRIDAARAMYAIRGPAFDVEAAITTIKGEVRRSDEARSAKINATFARWTSELPIVDLLGVVWVNFRLFELGSKLEQAGGRAASLIARAPLRSQVRLISVLFPLVS